jgi:hypothetical protein
MSFTGSNPIGSIGFKVTGLLESIKGLDSVMREWPIVEKAVLNEAGRFIVNEAKRNVHVVSGDLKNSISIEPVSSPKIVVVSAKTHYAKIENDRRGDKRQTPKSKGPYGPHDYFTRATAAVQRDFASRIKVNFDKLLQKHKLG